MPPLSEDDRVAEILRQIGCEYVRVASVSLDAPEHMIETRDRLGGLAAARHLVQLGHKRIGAITGPLSFRSSHERRMGFNEGLAEGGLAPVDANVLEGAYTYQSGVDQGLAMLRQTPRPTAIFAMNDEMAAGVLRAARELGVRVPEDLSVVGFDDFQIASRQWPALTTIHTPTREIGLLAAERLIGREAVSGRQMEDRLPRLVVRESTGQAPA